MVENIFILKPQRHRLKEKPLVDQIVDLRTLRTDETDTASDVEENALNESSNLDVIDDEYEFSSFY